MVGSLYKLLTKKYLSKGGFLVITIVIILSALAWSSVAISMKQVDQNSIGSYTAGVALMYGLGRIIAFIAVMFGTYYFASSLSTIKDSALFRRIYDTGTSKKEVLMATALFAITFYFGFIVLSILLFTIFPAFFGVSIDWAMINWIGFLVGIILMGILNFAIGYFFLSITNSYKAFSIVGSIYIIAYLLFVFTTIPAGGAGAINEVGKPSYYNNTYIYGTVAPFTFTPSHFGAIFYYLIPSYYSSEFFMSATLGGNVFGWSSPIIYTTIPGLTTNELGGFGRGSYSVGLALTNTWKMILDFFYPIVVGGMLYVLSIRLINWE